MTTSLGVGGRGSARGPGLGCARARRRRRRAAVPARHAAVRGDPLPRSARGVSQGDRQPTIQAHLASRRASASSGRRCGSASSSRPSARPTTLKQQDPRSADVLTVHADALWSAGLFDEADQEFKRRAGARAGACRAAVTAWRARWPRRTSSRRRWTRRRRRSSSSPRDGEIHHTVGAIFERMRRYEQAAAAYTNYINLLPNKDRSDKAAWSRSQVRFLQSFGEREPIAIDDDAAGQPAHRGLPPRRRQGHRQGAGQRRPPAGLRARHRLRADDDLAADARRARRARRSPTRSAPASAKSACAACSWGGSTRSRSAR